MKPDTFNSIEHNSLLHHALIDCLTDAPLSRTVCDAVKAALGIGELDAHEGLLLSWEGKAEALRLLRQTGTGGLTPDECANFDEAAQHVIVVGENLETMRLMQRTYHGCFKMAYLDPPYNTGSELVFEDHPTEQLERYFELRDRWGSRDTNAPQTLRHRHGRWLSMMLPRLVAVRNLLAEDGVVYVSIDDHELHRLRLVLDEVFGSENFVCTLVWEKRYSPAPDASTVGYVHENILCYRKSDAFATALLPMTDAQRGRYKNKDDDPRGPWKAADYTCRFSSTERPNLYYPVVNPNTGDEVWPKESRVWACSREEHERNVREARIWWPPNSLVPAKKRFVSEIRQGTIPSTLLTHEEVGHTDEATKELRAVWPGIKFTPKPTRLLRRLMEIANLKSGDLVLDPFAGSGTTADAAIAHETASGIAVSTFQIQFPEPIPEMPKRSIADIAVDRCRKALARCSRPGTSQLRVFHLTSSVFTDSAAAIMRLETASAELLRGVADNLAGSISERQIVTELLIRMGRDVRTRFETQTVGDATVFLTRDGLAICPCRSLPETIEDWIETSKVAQLVLLESAFGEDDARKLNMCQQLQRLHIPAAFY